MPEQVFACLRCRLIKPRYKFLHIQYFTGIMKSTVNLFIFKKAGTFAMERPFFRNYLTILIKRRLLGSIYKVLNKTISWKSGSSPNFNFLILHKNCAEQSTFAWNGYEEISPANSQTVFSQNSNHRLLRSPPVGVTSTFRITYSLTTRTRSHNAGFGNHQNTNYHIRYAQYWLGLTGRTAYQWHCSCCFCFQWHSTWPCRPG